jgi:hypothetical protein
MINSTYSNLSNASYSSTSSQTCQKNNNNQQRHKGNCCCKACINKYKYLAASVGLSTNKKNNETQKSTITLIKSSTVKLGKRKVLSVDALAENLAKKKLKLKAEQDEENENDMKNTLDRDICDKIIIQKIKKNEVGPLDLTTTTTTTNKLISVRKQNLFNNSDETFVFKNESEGNSEQKNDLQSVINSQAFSFFQNNVLSNSVFDNSSIISAVATLAAAFAAKNTDLKR